MGRHLLAAFALFLLSGASARAEESPKKPISAKIFGPGTQITTDGANAVHDMDPIPRRNPLDGAPSAPKVETPAPAAAPPPRPELWPVPPRAVAQRRATVEREAARKKEASAAASAVAQDEAAQTPAPTYSLWEGQAAPRALPAKPKAPLATDDAAAESGQQLYDGAAARTDTLPKPGQAQVQAQVSASPAPASASLSAPLETAAKPPAEVFVAVQLDLKTHPGGYKDAVADLGRAAAFRPDHRFEPAAPSTERVSLWGWMAPDRLAQAIGVKGVARLNVEPAGLAETRSMPKAGSGDSRYVIGIKVPDQARADESAAPVLKELAESGFRLSRLLGTQAAPGGELALVVEGTLPVRGLSRVMAHGRVLKVVPAESETPAPAAAAPSEGFLLYASQRAPLLLVLTLLLLIPPFGGSLLKLCEFFIPYQR